MSSKPVSQWYAEDRLEPVMVGGTGAPSGSSVQEIMLRQLDALPVVQWLSEAFRLEVQASFEGLLARLRFARERLLDASNPGGTAPDTYAPITTLLATDLEGFTPMLERLGDMRAQQLMHAHNEILRACLKRHHGREVAHTGDGMIAKFRSARHAMRCAIAMQRCLAEHNHRHPSTPLRVRIGLHAGVPLPEEDRLFGACVNVTVRVCSVTPPGDILTSDAVLGQLDQHDFRVQDRGVFALKGITLPVRLHKLSWEQRPQLTAESLN